MRIVQVNRDLGFADARAITLRQQVVVEPHEEGLAIASVVRRADRQTIEAPHDRRRQVRVEPVQRLLDVHVVEVDRHVPSPELVLGRVGRRRQRSDGLGQRRNRKRLDERRQEELRIADEGARLLQRVEVAPDARVERRPVDQDGIGQEGIACDGPRTGVDD